MGFLSTVQCTAVGCTNAAAVKVNDDLLCMHCAKHEIPADYQAVRAALIAEYTEAPIVKEAKMYVDMIRDGKMLNTREQTAAVSLARVTIMLGLYGSKAEAILHVIHEHGHIEVTLADVEAVRDYVLSN